MPSECAVNQTKVENTTTNNQGNKRTTKMNQIHKQSTSEGKPPTSTSTLTTSNRKTAHKTRKTQLTHRHQKILIRRTNHRIYPSHHTRSIHQLTNQSTLQPVRIVHNVCHTPLRTQLGDLVYGIGTTGCETGCGTDDGEDAIGVCCEECLESG